MKIKAGWVWFTGVLAAVFALVVAWTLGLGEMLRKREKEKASKELADELKAKVEALKHQEEARRIVAEAAVAKVEQGTKKEAERDSVDAANDLIASLRDGDGKGG